MKISDKPAVTSATCAISIVGVCTMIFTSGQVLCSMYTVYRVNDLIASPAIIKETSIPCCRCSPHFMERLCSLAEIFGHALE
jgi:hypothetical protein